MTYEACSQPASQRASQLATSYGIRRSHSSVQHDNVHADGIPVDDDDGDDDNEVSVCITHDILGVINAFHVTSRRE